MTGTATLTIEQYRAIDRLFQSLNPHDRESTKRIVITPASVFAPDSMTDFVRIKFDAGWGSTEFDITRDGYSAHVGFGGVSEISDADLDYPGLHDDCPVDTPHVHPGA